LNDILAERPRLESSSDIFISESSLDEQRLEILTPSEAAGAASEPASELASMPASMPEYNSYDFATVIINERKLKSQYFF